MTPSHILKLRVGGTTCHSCEITIERAWRKIDGVLKVDVNATKGVARIVCGETTPNFAVLQAAITEYGYTVKDVVEPDNPKSEILPARQSLDVGGNLKLKWWQLASLFALVLLLGSLFSKLGLFASTIALGTTTSIGAVFLLGLVAASSSCIAVSGGLLLSSAAKFNQRYGITPSVDGKTLGVGIARMQPVLLFVAGRLFAYALLGGLIGIIGKALSPSPFVTGTITILAALYMFVMGLDMLHITPRWLKALTPRLPKSLSHRLLSVEEKEHALAPALLGAATFFLPCGFTAALQLYALTTGSFITSASLLFAFALGTAPALLALGWVSGSLKGRAGRFFFQFAGALVVMLGLWNLQNGLTIAGYPMNVQRLTHLFALGGEASSRDPNVLFDGKTQTVRMTVNGYGYIPNHFTLRQNIPTRWVIDTQSSSGCLAVLQVPRLGIRRLLRLGTNTIEFTPRVAGAIPFSCSMGMFWGEINVVPNT